MRALNPTPQRGQTKTPYEPFYGRRPDVSTLRVFGCRAWPYLSPDIRLKMDPRALPATHLGYAEDSNEYRVLINGRVYVRRDVTLDEATRGTGKPWDAPAAADSERELALPAASEQSPIEEAIAAAQRLVGASAPPKESAGSDAEYSGSGTDAASDDVGTSDTQLDGAPVSPPSTNRPAASGDERGLTRRSLHLQLRDQRMQRAGNGATGLRAWALAASERGGPGKMRVYEARREENSPAFDVANSVEMQALWDKGTWDMVPLPQRKKVTRTELLCERKRGADGAIVMYKGRLVVHGDTQIPLINYTATWAPVARYTTLRLLLSHCTSQDVVLLQLDIATAFLNGEVEVELYIHEPRWYERGAPWLVCRLRKALFGLKQAALAWYRKLRGTLERAAFEACEADECLFKRRTFEGDVCFILVYVNGLPVAAQTVATAKAGQVVVTEAFKIKMMGEPNYFLSIHIEREISNRTLRLHQRQYVYSLVTRFGLEEANPVLIFMGAGVHLSKGGMLLDADTAKL